MVELHCWEHSRGWADLIQHCGLAGQVLPFLLYGLQSLFNNVIIDLGFCVALHCITAIVSGNKTDFRKPKVIPLQFFFLHTTANKKLCQSEINWNLQG